MKYERVIVGGGSAGCVLATRLSEHPNCSVLLLEAGADYPEFEQVPDELKYLNNRSSLVGTSPYNWHFEAKLSDRRPEPVPVDRGKVVGGSSSIHGAMFIRGIPEDFDNWASWGNSEWSAAKVLPYFRKAERDLDIQDDFHGSDGPLPVRRFKRDTWDVFQQGFVQACLDEGFPQHEDLNNPNATGVTPVPRNEIDGIRFGAALAYLNPARHRLNLTVKSNCLVRRILFSGRKATGVEIESGGEKFLVEGEEIVLSAGTVASPQILMLSGIGDASHLSTLGIPVVQHLPGVGQNLRAHPTFRVKVRTRPGIPRDYDDASIKVALSLTAQGSSDRNDLRILPQSYLNRNPNPVSVPSFDFQCQLFLPLGSGEIRLNSADLSVQPYFNFGYFEHPSDRRRMREAIRLAAHFSEQKSFSGLVEDIISPTRPELGSDEALDLWMLQNATGSGHIVGTCKMGPASDPMAVVDQYCRVYGVEGLRVVDASVMPDVVRANTFATVVMIAEHAADWLQQDIEG